MKYYVYAYLRDDGTPYYVGKGKDRRAWNPKHSVSVPKDESKIVMLHENLTEDRAFELEINLIKEYGRKDLGTGILRNLTNGGDGPSGMVVTEERRKKISDANKGKPSPMKGRKNPGLSSALKGKPKSPEHIEKVRNALKGKPNPKVSQARKGVPSPKRGRPQEKIKCPHCNKEGGLPQMKQWHFDNCKENNVARPI
jgi:hypothetical protein